MADKAFKLLLCLFLLWSGYYLYCLAAGLLDAWASGRFAAGGKRDAFASHRIVRWHKRPVEFWFTMALLHAMLVALKCGFGWGVYGGQLMIAGS